MRPHSLPHSGGGHTRGLFAAWVCSGRGSRSCPLWCVLLVHSGSGPYNAARTPSRLLHTLPATHIAILACFWHFARENFSLPKRFILHTAPCCPATYATPHLTPPTPRAYLPPAAAAAGGDFLAAFYARTLPILQYGRSTHRTYRCLRTRRALYTHHTTTTATCRFYMHLPRRPMPMPAFGCSLFQQSLR